VRDKAREKKKGVEGMILFHVIKEESGAKLTKKNSSTDRVRRIRAIWKKETAVVALGV